MIVFLGALLSWVGWVLLLMLLFLFLVFGLVFLAIVSSGVPYDHPDDYVSGRADIEDSTELIRPGL